MLIIGYFSSQYISQSTKINSFLFYSCFLQSTHSHYTHTHTLSRPPHLVAVLVGDDAASSVYVSNKTKAAQKCGIMATTKKLHKGTTQEELLDLVDRLNMDKEVRRI